MKLNVGAVDPKLLEDPEVRALLAEADAIIEANPLQNYWPHSKQMAFHMAKVKEKVFLGGNRSGKSTAGGVDNIIQAIDAKAVPKHLAAYKIWEPPFYCRIVTPDFTRTLKAVTEVLRKWCPPDQLRGGSWEKAYEKQERVLHFANGSFFEFMTYEQDIDKFGGSARHRIHYDEEPDGEKGEEVREECIARLIDYHGDEIFTFTPLNGLGWTFEEFWEEKGPEVERDVWLNERMVVVRSDMDDNPHLDTAGKERALASYPERVREARKAGNFSHFKGLVYDSFDPELHVVARPPLEHVQGLTQYDGIDPGIQTTAILFGGFDKDNCLLIYDELYLSDRWAIPENAAERIRDKRRAWGLPERPKYTLIDPSARNRSLTDADRVQAAYYRAGIKAVPAQNDVEAGVFELMRRLEHRDGEGRLVPLVLIAENCVHLRKEVSRYRLDTREDGGFAVIKRDDHGPDALRYIAMARPLAPLPRQVMRPARQTWIPGTAPPFRPKSTHQYGPMGKFA